MSIHDCTVCGAYSVFEHHVCPPVFHVWCLDYDHEEDDALKVRAHSVEEAAEKWAMRSDSDGDYTIVRGTEVVVMVRKEGEADAKALVVHGETVPHYSARDAEACHLCSKLTPVPDCILRVEGDRKWVHDACKRKATAVTEVRS